MGGRDHRSMQKGQIKPVYHKKKIKEDPCRTPNKKIHTTWWKNSMWKTTSKVNRRKYKKVSLGPGLGGGLLI